MSWRFTGRARVNAQSPEAFGICDRDGMLYNLKDLHYQYEYRGPQLQNLRIRVCSRCMDRPAAFLKPLIIPPDPLPVRDPRPMNFTAANAGTSPLPPLPWPTQPIGPVDPAAPAPPTFVQPEPAPYITQPPDPPPFVPPGLESEP